MAQQWLRGALNKGCGGRSTKVAGAAQQRLRGGRGGAGAQAASFTQTLAAFKYPGAYKPFSILLLVFIFQQLSGSYAVIFYAVTLFKNIGVSTSPYVPAIITGLIRLLGTLIGTALIKVSSQLLSVFSIKNIFAEIWSKTLDGDICLSDGFFHDESGRNSSL